jgi:osmotically-inducible protein OsmY
MKSDSQLQQDVLAELKWEPAVHAAQIGVEARDGVVTLAGHVGSFAEKWNAEQAAQRVCGVRALAVEIDVELAGAARRSDADIARSAKNLLDWTSSLPKDTVKVRVESGWVTLSGKVDWHYQRQAAADGIRHLAGVTGVSNDIAITPSAASSTIQSDVQAALKRGAWPAQENISVAVDAGEVTLTGNVHSWAERDLAAHCAWNAAGVHNVINEITLVS